MICPFFGSSGYANHSRGLFNSLAKLTEVKLTTQLVQGWERDVNDRELEAIKRVDVSDSINLIIDLPHNWKLHTKNGRNWAYCVWEGDGVPDSWIDDFINPDIEYIFVPSEHTKNAIENILTDNEALFILPKIKIISHGVNLDLFYPKETKRERFTFLCNKGWRNLEDRGGVQYAVKAYLEEFTNKDNVSLMLKLNPAYPIGDLNQMIKQLSPDRKDLPQIQVNINNVPYNKLVELYNQSDVFLAPTRSDAFNIPCLEALACGKPVITSSFGGQTDFVNNENGWIIDGDLTEVKHEIPYEGIKWLTPNLTKLKEAMRNAYEMQTKTKAAKALETARNLTWDLSAKKIINLI